ncbi:unnamed protein product, partial [Prorocentrum cordatum]
MMLHRVRDFPPGLFLLARGSASAAELRRFADGSGLAELRLAALADELAAELAELEVLGCALLAASAAVPADVRQVAQLSACNQEVAGDGSFAAAFVGQFCGWAHPRRYLELLWEAGYLGHVLHLAATSVGFGATGIGCFFDDFALGLLRSPRGGLESAGDSRSGPLGPEDAAFQVLYLFRE